MIGRRRMRRDELENNLNRGALWAVTYGDLMSYLMIFFLVLFSFSLSKGVKTPAGRRYEESIASIQKVFGGKASEERLKKLRLREREEAAARQLTEAVQTKDLSKYVEIKTTEEKMLLELKEPVLFDLGRAELKANADAVLREIATHIKHLPNPVLIEGHTDNVPIRGGRYASNWELSMARAHAVIRFFEGEGMDPKRLSGAGYGEHRPSADNASAEGRAKNRRIEIVLVRVQ